MYPNIYPDFVKYYVRSLYIFENFGELFFKKVLYRMFSVSSGLLLEGCQFDSDCTVDHSDCSAIEDGLLSETFICQCIELYIQQNDQCTPSKCRLFL